MNRFFATLAWLCVGHAAVFGLFWLLLQVPESNAWMLATSALIVAAGVILLGVVDASAILSLRSIDPMSAAVRSGLRRGWLVVFPLAVFGCLWWLTGAASSWLSRHAGEMDAWIIAKTGWTATAGLHAALGWIIAFVRYGVGASLAITWMGQLASRGVAGLVSNWIRDGIAWTRLLVVSAALLIGIWLPWQAVYWRPASLPATWIEPAFAAIKLLVLFVVANVAWAVVLRSVPRRTAS
jgi:hypothetical protein